MTNSQKSVQPYGLWPSPITTGLISQRIGLSDVQFAGDGQTLVWWEGLSNGSALIAQTGTAARRSLTDEQSPRGGVGYGGGIFSIGGETLLFADRDGRIYRRGLGFERPYPITPAYGPNPTGMVASPVLSPDGNWALYVYSDGKTDLLALVDAEGSQWPIQRARGADFYMQPAWHPDGDRIAWVEWDHPNMPWDGARVQLAAFDENPAAEIQAKTVGGGDQIPAQQPLFSPDGHWLAFAEENGEWSDLILFDLQNSQRRVLVKGDGFDVAPPTWVQGIRSIGWRPDSQALFYFRYQGPNISLWSISLVNGQSIQIDTAPYTWLSQLAVAPMGNALAFLASAANQPDQIVRWDGTKLVSVAYSTAWTYDPAYLPSAQEISWATTDGSTVYGLYYPPVNAQFTGSGLPPAIVGIHGGPTSIVSNRFDGEVAYFTSRGYAYIKVNYRGSTGYGRTYRHAMRQRWGDVDVEDAASCAQMLGERKLADPKRLVITGGSAGGYTVLNTLIRYPGLYKAGVCLYGVTNLFALDLDTHKFEAHYNASMIGPLPEAAGRYHAWSPVYHADRIQDALYIFQGNEDKVVPPNQSEEIIAVLRSRGIPYQYKLYAGEGHGFRKSETIADYLKETERFLQQHVLFAP